MAFKVFDLMYPSTIPLRELSAIAVTIGLWRLDGNRYVRTRKAGFEEDVYCEYFDPEPTFTLQDIIPFVPPAIDLITQKYMKRLRLSAFDWLAYMNNRIFRFCRINSSILKDFNDIVCDLDGTIHYVRTAKRLLLWDRLSLDEKFRVACEFSFEEDIRQIWPSVQNKIDLDEIYHNQCPILHYWVCFLRNEVYKIPNRRNSPIGEIMIINKNNRFYENRSSLDYFWNLAKMENKDYLKIVTMFPSYTDENFEKAQAIPLGRFILPKFNELQLTDFLAVEGAEFVHSLCCSSCTKPEARDLVLNIWYYMKDNEILDKTTFVSLIENIMLQELDEDQQNDYVSLCSKIWIGAEDNFKQSASKHLLAGQYFFNKTIWRCVPPPTKIQFLPMLLEAVTLEDRSVFWNNNWMNLLCLARVEDFNQIVDLCFANDEEISRFRKHAMAIISTARQQENLVEMFKRFLDEGYFTNVAYKLNFICLDDAQTRRDLKRQCLHRLEMKFCDSLFWKTCEPNSIHEFIDDAYAYDPALAKDFRDQLLSSADTENKLFKNILNCFKFGFQCKNADTRRLLRVKEFIDSFASRGHIVEKLKKRLVRRLKWQIINFEYFQYFLIWCLGSDNRLVEVY